MDAHDAISAVYCTRDRRKTRDNMPVLVRRGTRDNLPDVYKRLGYKVGAEIGTRKGFYAMVMCKWHPDMFLYCVDPWLAYNYVKQQTQDIIYEEAKKNLADYNVKIIRKASMDALADFKDDSLDFVFIDGNHTFDHAVMDIICWSKKVKHGGIVGVHDYMPGAWAGVMPAVDGYTSSHDIRPWYLTREKEPTAFWVNERDNRLFR